MDPRFLTYYNRELRYLRELGGEFARDFPKIAARLGLDAFACADPYVERLLEGFAFLAARVQLRIDDEFPRFSEQLLAILCPHLVTPLPSMTVVEFRADERQGSLGAGFLIPRGTALRATLAKPEAICEYRTAHDLTLWPVEVTGVTVAPLADAGGFPEGPARSAKGVLKLRLKTTNGAPFGRLSLDRLSIFVRNQDSAGWRLFEAMCARTLGGSIGPAGKAPIPLRDFTVAPAGLTDGEAMLPVGPRTFQGYRLLSEYFAFPPRFAFVEVAGLGPGIRACDSTEIDLLLALDRIDPALEAAARTANVSLWCTPAVNLFPKRADRVQLSDADFEYHVVPDRAHPLDFEVHSVLSVQAFGAKGEALREFLPIYKRDPRSPNDRGTAFFTTHRRPWGASLLRRPHRARSPYQGSEVFVSLVDGADGAFGEDLRQISAQTLCTNRDLPLLLPTGEGATDFVMSDAAPVRAIRCVAGPSTPRAAHAVGETTWRLIKQVSIQKLALADASGDAHGLRELLALHANGAETSSERQIQGVLSLRSRPIARRLSREGPPAFARGSEMTLECDELAFEGTSSYALGLVLARFFARQASINSFAETVLRTTQRGEVGRWKVADALRGES